MAGNSKSFFSNVFLIVGSVLFGLGMIWAGILKLEGDQTTAGIALIAGAAVIIALCALPVIQANRKERE